MHKNKMNEELQSRREFFKKAAKGVLPILGAIILSNVPTVLSRAHTISECGGCSGSCKGGCSSTCDGGCRGGCRNGCKSTCTLGCHGQTSDGTNCSGCTNQCYSSCSGGCRGGCKSCCEWSSYKGN